MKKRKRRLQKKKGKRQKKMMKSQSFMGRIYRVKKLSQNSILALKEIPSIRLARVRTSSKISRLCLMNS